MIKKFVFIPNSNALTNNSIKKWIEQLSDIFLDWTFHSPKDKEDALLEISDADAAYGTMDKDLLSAAKKIKWLQAPAAAPDEGFYFDELINHPIIVTNFKEIYNDHISVQILSYILSFAKNSHIYRDQQNEKNWKQLPESEHEIFLPESTVLIIGVGGIGLETARICKAIGMKTIGIDSKEILSSQWLDEIFPAKKLMDHVNRGDFIVSTIPHNPITEGMFNYSFFNRMKNSSFFINIGRGKTTSLIDLNKAIIEKKIAGAALDVFEKEPLDKKNKLWTYPNVIITPHIAAHGGKYLDERRFDILRENIKKFQDDKKLKNVVNKNQWH
ncbi:MAG: hydroxyacid dehydrogenase [Chloroflexi bacterium]|nr:hydroxyacid dehydrogenase [Chloroflexota bacterium]